jgi:hypothetical protein
MCRTNRRHSRGPKRVLEYLHEATGLHRPDRRRGGRVAARGARAQQPAMRTIGFLGSASVPPRTQLRRRSAFDMLPREKSD